MEHEIWCRGLRDYRIARGLTQEDVALALNISRSQYSSLENGRSVINYKQLYNMAKFFQMTMARLLTLLPKSQNDS